MKKALLICALSIFAIVAAANASDPAHKQEYSSSNGYKTVRTVTPNKGNYQNSSSRRLPVRNPQILAQVVWVDRDHENAISKKAAISPDGYNILAGWQLNHERYSSYVSTGLQWPVWEYRQEADGSLPVDATNSGFAGTDISLPVYLWDHNSPLFIDQYDFNAGFVGIDVSFSGDGNLLAIAGSSGSNGILIIYDITTQDTVFTRIFERDVCINGVDISSDGSTVVVSMYNSLLVYSIPNGDFMSIIYNYSQNIARISGDGSLIVIGTFTGYFYLCEWNGTDYEYRWVRPIQHDWVTAVDVSDDGSTVACGTLDFQSGGNYGGKFMMWDAVTADVLIEYDEYGDEVSSVALSSDGRYAIVGSWGKYDGTYGDVITCFIRDTDIPIFQLLDDVDEPGSAFVVAISDSGHYAVAGGKAVHARQMGNGGMVYSIMLKDPLDYDVAVASIDEPGELVNPGETITPSATFINVGSNATGFSTSCTITNLENNEVVYTSSYEIDYLGSFSYSSVFFTPDFTIPEDGRYKIEFTADLDTDENDSNNNLSLILRSYHDLKVNTLISPFDEITINWPCAPQASFSNLGSYNETFEVTATISDSTNVVYQSTSMIYNLAPYAAEEVIFDEWTPTFQAPYDIVFSADVQDDIYPDNNYILKYFDVVDEMIYDDGYSDIGAWVGSYPNSANRKFAQKFEPNFQLPFTVTNIRLFIDRIPGDGILDYVGVTQGGTTYPDTNNYLTLIEYPTMPVPNNWASYSMNAAVDNNQPLWLVLHWPDCNDLGPYIGADETGTIDRQSYWYSNGQGWNLYTLRDWMIRMTLQEGVGIESEYIVGLPSRITMINNYPNPFNSSTIISFAMPNPGEVTIEIYNSLGQKVKSLTKAYYDAGYHSVIWDGKSDSGSDIASGIYYCRLISGSQRVSQNMMLLK